MQLRHNVGSRPQITFTSDFHELVQGDLVPGPCLLRYDPLRLVALNEPEDHHNIRAFVRFHPTGVEWQGVMSLPAGTPLADQADICGQGFMLTAPLTIPSDCDAIEAWFSCSHPDGETHWDSDHGKNHWLRFGLADLTIKSATVAAAKKNAVQDTFKVEVTTKPCIESVDIRWRQTKSPQAPRIKTPLKANTDGSWSTPKEGIPVAKNSVIAFDIIYTVAGRTFTDDNQGRWYIAD